MADTKKQQNYKSDTFFEAFRDLGELGQQTARTLKNDLLKGTVADAWNDMLHGESSRKSGELRPYQPLEFPDELSRHELEARNRERHQLIQLRRKEQLVYSRKREEIERQIKAIQEELKKILGETSELAQEFEVAVEQVIVEPGVYHLNFFDKLRQLLILLRKKISDSKTWMHTTNVRSKQRSFYWGQVVQSGTKFLLSQERYMSTQAG